MHRHLSVSTIAAALLLTVACGPPGAQEAPAADDAQGMEAAAPRGQPSPLADQCAADNDGLSLPPGFCAMVFHPGVGAARHLEVRDDGTVFVAVTNRRTSRSSPPTPGGVVALRDTDGDGVADSEERWGENGGNEVLLDGETVWFATNDAVLRYHVPAGSVMPDGPPDTVVSGLPATQSHTAKSLALGPGGALYVNIGSPSNACQAEARTAGSAGIDPCPQLETRAGIWRFDAGATGQTQADGERFATGLRNVVALTEHPGSRVLFGVQHGRDQLNQLFPDLYAPEESAELPAEELVRIEAGDDFGWPYCYFDHLRGVKLLAPEYGGDTQEVGRCAEKKDPVVGFPGHWAPNDLAFYTGTQFPADHRGAFIAFHGSWNRAPLPQEGYNVVMVRMEGTEPTTEWEVFADGFRSEEGAAGEGRMARPVGLSVGPDGSLYVSDSREGRIWRVVYGGS